MADTTASSIEEVEEAMQETRRSRRGKHPRLSLTFEDVETKMVYARGHADSTHSADIEGLCICPSP